MCKISVILPVYNSEKTIRATVLSVLNQSEKNIELIIINDGSKDQTVQIIEEISDDRTCIFSYPNKGVGAARNKGVQFAKGEYITFIDSDDLWMPDKLKDQLSTLADNPDCKVVYSWVSIIDEKGFFLRTVDPMRYKGDVYAPMLERCFIANGSNLMLHRSVFNDTGYFNETLKWAQDYDFYIRLAKKHKFALCPYYHIFYRQSMNAHSSRVKPVEDHLIKVINNAFLAAPGQLLHLRGKALSYNCQHIANKFIDTQPGISGSFSAFKRLFQAILYYPQRLFSVSFWGITVKGVLNFILPVQLSRHIFKWLYSLETKMNKNWNSEILCFLTTAKNSENHF